MQEIQETRTWAHGELSSVNFFNITNMESAKAFMYRRNIQFNKELDRYKKNPKDSYLKWFPDINRLGKYGILREKWTLMKQHNIDEKILIVERFKLIRKIEPTTHKNLKIGDVEYRLGYYMVGKNGNRKGRWTWGESCPIIPKRDFAKLINKAKRDGTID